MKSNLGKNFIYSFIYEVLIVLTPLVITPYISRVLGVELVGIRSLTYAILSYFEIFASLGIAVYGQKEIARYSNDMQKRSRIFFNLLLIKTIVFFTVLAVYCTLFFCFNFMPEYKGLWLLWLIHLFEQFFNVTWFFIGIESFKLLAVRGVIIRILQIVLTFVLVRTQNDFYSYILLYAGTPLLQAISLWPMLFKNVVIVKGVMQDTVKHFKKIIHYFIPTIATVIYSNIDKVMISFITNSNESIGLYDSAQSIALLSTTIFSSLFKVMCSRVSNELDKIDIKHKKLFQEIAFFVVSALSFGIFSLADSFVEVFFGHQYIGAGILLRLFSAMIFIMGISQYISSTYIVPFGKQNKVNKYYGIAIVVNIITNSILIRILGASGAVIGSILAEIAVLYGMLKIYFQAKGNNFNTQVLFKNIAAGVIMSIVCYVFNLLISHRSIAVLILEAVTGAIVYIGVLHVLRYSVISNIICILKKGERDD